MAISFDPQANSAFRQAISEYRYRMDPHQTNLQRVLDQFKPICSEHIRSVYQENYAIKAGLVIHIQYHSKKFSFNAPMDAYLRSKMYLIYRVNEVETVIDSMYQEINARNENFMRGESNLEIVQIQTLSILTGRFQPLAGIPTICFLLHWTPGIAGPGQIVVIADRLASKNR